MKKNMVTFISTILCINLCACGSGNSKEKMLSDAIELNLQKAYDECEANEVRAREKYDGTIVKYTGMVYNIDSNVDSPFVIMKNGEHSITVSGLSKDDIVKLDKRMIITVVGKFYFMSTGGGVIKNTFILEQPTE